MRSQSRTSNVAYFLPSPSVWCLVERDKLIYLDVSRSPNTREPAINIRATQDIKGRFLNVILPFQTDLSELQWYSL